MISRTSHNFRPPVDVSQPVMAIAYDFDGTLSPGNMQEYSFLPALGIQSEAFWAECQDIASAKQADPVLVYMNLMLRKAHERNHPLRRVDFMQHGKDIPLFEGVREWFSRINTYAASRQVRIFHYLISSGNMEIFEGTAIAGEFRAIYASRYFFDDDGVAIWPALAINYTAKTQFLFRINKGIEDINDNASVNRYTPESKRPIPFSNMIFIGDGPSDIPCFRLVKDQGGLSIAVYMPHVPDTFDQSRQYLADGRVHAMVPADYTAGSRLDRLVRARIDFVAARHAMDRLLAEEAGPPHP